MNRVKHGMRVQRGFSVVELMIAMTLSLLLMAGALAILQSSKMTYNENDRLARLQEAGRTVVELMLRDARPAGFLGCSRPLNGDEFANGLNNSNSLLWNFAQPAFGFEATGGAWSPALDALVPNATVGSDVLVLRTSRQGQPVFRINTPVTNTAAVIQVDSDPGAAIAADTPMIIGDCEGSSVFMATSYNALSATTGEISHAIAVGGGDGNTSADLTRGFVLGAQVMPVQTVVYYVRPSDAGTGPALWQRVGTTAPQELVDGVQNLQVRFGVDTDNNLQADVYQTADAVNAANNWPRVVSVEVAVLVQSPQETGPEKDSRTYNLLGTNLGPFNDRRQRAVFTTTVVLRNRAL
jgi:type IV pilus assembly protein PilW